MGGFEQPFSLLTIVGGEFESVAWGTRRDPKQPVLLLVDLQKLVYYATLTAPYTIERGLVNLSLILEARKPKTISPGTTPC